MLVSSNTKYQSGCIRGCIWIWPLMHLYDLRGRHPSFAPLCEFLNVLICTIFKEITRNEDNKNFMVCVDIKRNINQVSLTYVSEILL